MNMTSCSDPFLLVLLGSLSSPFSMEHISRSPGLVT